jgi:hypothetical protein
MSFLCIQLGVFTAVLKKTILYQALMSKLCRDNYLKRGDSFA